MKESINISRFWAKTTDDKNNLERQNAFHPLICHLIDVAVTAQAIWDKVLPETTKKKLAKPFGLEDDLDKAGWLIALLVGLHDLGKCSPPFTLRGENDKGKGKQTERLLELYRNTECFCTNFKPTSIVPHGFVTSVELPAILQDKFKFPEAFAENIAEIIGGHHGVFPTSGKIEEIKGFGKLSLGDENWQKARRDFVDNLARLLKIEGDFSNIPNAKLDNATAMIFAGLTTVADWIGSNADFFPCEIEDSKTIVGDENFSPDLDKYLEKSKQNAEKALKTLGWTNWVKETEEKSFGDLFPLLPDKRHLQNVAIEIAEEIDSVGIAVVESPMGEGKTEAAMYLADVFNAKLGLRGIYFALPTQATSNQMFGRVEKFLDERFKGEDLNVHLMLQHGHASISDAFLGKIENFGKNQNGKSEQPTSEDTERIGDFQNIQNISDDGENADQRKISNVVAAEWFTYKKRGLLVPFGVGTIDQILLAALQTKHVFVRLFGLAHKTIIIDEVHAYDAYMSTLLERLLEWLAALGSPVVILSATLPKKKRDLLIKAYLKGLGKITDNDLPTSDDDDCYPRISYAMATMPDKTFKIRQLETSDQNKKTLYIEWKDDNFIAELKTKLAREGGCVAIICNTVDKAQTLYAELAKDEFFQGLASDNFPKLDLLHARFRFCERDEREEHSLQRFGKPDENSKSPHRPKMAVLISTQIIEQSLDLDFDLMISELAPADLLLQRSGRLQRHDRQERKLFKNTPTLWLLKPPTNANGNLLITKNGLPDFGKSGVVYDKHILLRSWLKLREGKPINIPNDIENLIEDVYDADKTFENLSEQEKLIWQETLKTYQKDCELEEDQAKNRYIKHPHYSGHLGRLLGEPKEEDAPELHPVHQAQTRLVEPTANVVCLWEKDGKIYTDETFAEEILLTEKPDKDTTKKLLFSSLTVSSKSVVFNLLREEVPRGWEKSALLMRHRILKFGTDRKCEMFSYIFHLDENLGLRITKKEEK